ncbi:uncharacterized protein N7498_010278 [Penicillium cinerascens]|uniref:Uncharacterized protein n=1 Tax=Penicillium cinerascens TaxID=70096 RepID=A0A9W9J651_9EURO|nr:uncharacterized protein N7498_010278 [Penicillium cinerascens]KAJ5191293.1 hypothetical protein N7498_010278 [Penicillium cinerascens]
MLDVALVNYTSMHGSYHGYFEDYVEYVKKEVPTTLDNLMQPSGIGNGYFECTVSAGGTNISTTTCPYKLPASDNVNVNLVIYYTPLNATAFWDWLLSGYGLQRTWVQLTDHVIENHCSTHIRPNQPVCHEQVYTWKGYPMAADNIVVSDPATIIESTYPKIANLKDTIALTRILISTGSWGGSTDDAVLGISTAVFTMVQKKELDEEIIMALLLVVPFLGEIDAISESLAGLADIIKMFSDVSLLADSIYEVATASDTKKAIMGIFGVLLLGGVRTVEEFQTMGRL